MNKVIENYKKWVKDNNYVSYYGDFDSVEQLKFAEGENGYINVTHPDGAEDYGEGENGGVNGFISPVFDFFEGEFDTSIPYPTKEDWEGMYGHFSRADLKKLAKKFGLVLDVMEDIELARPRVKGQEFLSHCTVEEIENYVNFFGTVSRQSVFDEEMSYFAWSIPGHDDYYKFEEVDGVWYIFYITRYDPNF